MKLIGFSSSVIAAAAISIAVSVAPAHATSFDTPIYFNNIPGGATDGDAFKHEFFYTVSTQGLLPNEVLFKIFNTAPSGSTRFISEVAFELTNNAGLLSNMVLNSGNIGTVGFQANANGNLPQGNLVGINNPNDFNATRISGGGNAQAIQTGEALGIKFNYTGTSANLIDKLDKHSLLLGIHVQALPNGQSDTYATIPTPALLPGLIGLGLGVIRKRRSEQAQESEA